MKSRFWFSGAILAVVCIGLFLSFWRPQRAPKRTETVAQRQNFQRQNSPRQGLSVAQWLSEASRRLREYDRDHPRTVVASPRNFAGRDATNVSTHPAWQLAARLNGDERFAVLPASVIAPNANIELLGNGDISGLNRFSASPGAAVGDGFGASEGALGRWLDGGGQNGVRIFARDLARLEAQARAKQNASLNDFLLTLAARQEARRSQIGASLRAGIGEDVELARRLDPGALEPFVPTESDALRLINLRLDLLNTLRTPETQKEAAAEERLERETAFRAALREQELERRRLLNEFQTTLPARLQIQRETAMETTLRTLAQNDASARDSAITSGRELIAQDFTARNARLGIELPSRAPRLARNQEPASTSNVAADRNRTRRVSIPSNADTFARESALGPLNAGGRGYFSGENVVVGGGATGRLARDLALDDVRQWQRIAFRRQQAWKRFNAKPKSTVVQTVVR